jgi:MinD-like ATPase involved in chromosome partitioning or flagellar assembly
VALVVLGSNRSSPGVTTAAVAIGASWCRPGREPLVVEADPDGGVLAARFGLGAHPSLTELAGRTRAGLRPTDAWDHAQQLPGGLGVIVAHPSAEQTQAALRTGAEQIGHHLADVDHTDVLLDAGCLRPGSPSLPFLEWAAILLVVLRPRLDEISALAQRLALLQERADVSLVLVGTKPYGAAEVASTLGVEVVAVLADDPRGAAAVDGSAGTKRWTRSALAQTASGAAAVIAARLSAEESTLDVGAVEEELRGGAT